MSKEKASILRLTLRRFRSALGMLARSESGPRAVALLAALFALMLGINGLNVVNSYVGRDFMSAIEHQNMDGFKLQATLYIGVFVGSTIVAVFYRFCEERLGLLWRQQLTRRLTDAYLSDRTYYKLDSATGVANPDQRIAEDVRAFTTTTLSFSLLIVNGSLTAISFSGVLWSISPKLFVVAVSYALGGSLLTIWLGRPLIRLNYNQFDLEADFRADLIHVRENSESIALAHREGRFRARILKHLDALTSNYRHLIGVNRNLGFFTTGYNYLIQIIPALLVAPLFIKGKVEFGVITQSAMAFATLLGAFSIIVTQFQSISAFTAVTARLYALSEAILDAHSAKTCTIALDEHPDEIAFQEVTLNTTDNSRVLIEKLNVSIPRATRWVVVGPEDAPKVALFRATAGLWICGEGRVCRPGLEETLFLPERPYLPPGPLREVLLRTGKEATTPDVEIFGILAKMGIEDLVRRVGGLDIDQDWDDLLSIGEQHQLSIARILLARPAFVCLDRPGSALSKEQIALALDLLKAQGIGVIVFAKNGESMLCYDASLELMPEGKWALRQRSASSPEDHAANLSC